MVIRLWIYVPYTHVTGGQFVIAGTTLRLVLRRTSFHAEHELTRMGQIFVIAGTTQLSSTIAGTTQLSSTRHSNARWVRVAIVWRVWDWNRGACMWQMAKQSTILSRVDVQPGWPTLLRGLNWDLRVRYVRVLIDVSMGTVRLSLSQVTLLVTTLYQR